MKYAVEMGSGAMIYIPSFIKIGGRGFTDKQAHRQHGDRINLLLFLQNKESRLKHKKSLRKCLLKKGVEQNSKHPVGRHQVQALQQANIRQRAQRFVQQYTEVVQVSNFWAYIFTRLLQCCSAHTNWGK
jgi:hypothetical protein